MTMKSNPKFSKLPVAMCAVALMSLTAAQSATVFPIVTNNGDTSASFATDGTNYLVGIQGDYVGPDSYQITAQMFGPTGALVGPRISPVPGHTGGNPYIAFSGSNYLMVWPDDYGEGISNHSCVNGQLISPSGTLVGSTIAVTANYQQHFMSTRPMDYGDGKYLVVWDDYSSGTASIYGQLISAAGALAGTQMVISSDVNYPQHCGTVAFDGTNFLIVWEKQISSNPEQWVTYGIFISPSGAMGTSFAISQTNSPSYNPPKLVFNGTNYFIVWNRDTGLGYPNPIIWNIDGRFMTPSGSFVGNEFAIVTNGNPVFPGLAFDGANYLLSWGQNVGATNSNVCFQFLNGNGQPIGCQFTPFTAQGSQVPLLAIPLFDGKRFVAVATLSSGGMTPPTNGAGVYGVFIPASTAPPQFCAGATCTNSQFSLSLAGTPGINYAIQMTTNLASLNWISLTTNSPTNGTFSFTDTSSTNRSRFYRAVKQ